jgi:hypothetical protein
MKAAGDDGPGCLLYDRRAEDSGFRILCHLCSRALNTEFLVRTVK